MTEFPTSDLQLAAFLRLVGHEPLRIDGEARHKVFVFRDVPAHDLSSFYTGERRINAQALFREYRALRALVFQSR